MVSISGSALVQPGPGLAGMYATQPRPGLSCWPGSLQCSSKYTQTPGSSGPEAMKQPARYCFHFSGMAMISKTRENTHNIPVMYCHAYDVTTSWRSRTKNIAVNPGLRPCTECYNWNSRGFGILSDCDVSDLIQRQQQTT